MHYSIDAFAEGSVAMMFNYSWHVKTVQNKSPKLNFGVAQIPQFAGSQRINYANYWAYGVTKNKIIDPNAPTDATSGSMRAATNDERVKEAWKFLAFLTTKPETAISITSTVGGGSTTSGNFDPAAIYISKAQVPSARRDIIETQKADPNLGVFATDNLISKSWRQKDPESFEGIFSEMIDQVNKGQISIYDALDSASSRMNAIMNK
jgi:ABC-type glycerol-3-phosphate transport system substrate-binding protein